MITKFSVKFCFSKIKFKIESTYLLPFIHRHWKSSQKSMNVCSTTFILDSRLFNFVICPPKNGVTAPLFMAPKFKISVSESELCTVNLKKSPLFLTFVSFEKKGTKNWMLQSATLPPSPHPNPTYPSPLITIIRNQILGPPNLVTWLINNFQEKNNGQFPYLLSSI